MQPDNQDIGRFPEKLAYVCEELGRIGIQALPVSHASGFLEGIRIVNGVLHVSPNCSVSNVLHEAGHLAIIPAIYRSKANDDISKLQREMLDDMTRRKELPDSPLYRAVLQTSDPEATAWAYAFGKHLGLKDEEIIQADDYKDSYGEGVGESILEALSFGAYFGVHGLAHAGFCSTRGLGGLPKYPQLAFWTQNAQ